MDNQCLVLLSKFSVSARKAVGTVNPAKLLKDRQYATEIFQQIDNVGDEALILLSLDLQNQLGLLDLSSAETEQAENKYVFGARG